MMTYARATTAPANPWPSLPAPRINTRVPHSTFRAAKAAMRAVDKDIERMGAVTYETVEQVRAALALMRLS